MSTVAEITTAVRVQIQEFSPVNIKNATIEALINSAVTLLWNKIKSVSPEYATRRKSISSDSNVFVWPSDCMSLITVWDMKSSAKTITGATQASPVVMTSASHGLSTGQIITQHDVGGNSAANGTFSITKIDANSYSLDGSTGDGAYTSGGKAFRENSSFTEIARTTQDRSRGQNRDTWHPRGRVIVVNLNSFSNDLVIDYVTNSTPALSDIPAEYHEGIAAFCIIKTIDAKSAGNALMSLNLSIWETTLLSIAETFQISNAPTPYPKGIDWDSHLNDDDFMSH